MVMEYREHRSAVDELRESGNVVPAAWAGGAEATAYHQLEDDEFREATAGMVPTFKQWLIDWAEARRDPEA